MSTTDTVTNIFSVTANGISLSSRPTFANNVAFDTGNFASAGAAPLYNPVFTANATVTGTTTTGNLVVTGSTVIVPSNIQFTSLADGAKINLYTNAYAIGTQGSTAYVRTAGDFTVYANGVHSGVQGDPGTGGTTLLRANTGVFNVYSGSTSIFGPVYGGNNTVSIPGAAFVARESANTSGSKRASIQIGNSWQPMQDINGNGTRDFGMWNSSKGQHAFIIGANNEYISFATRPVFNGYTAWDSGNFNPANYAATSGTSVITGTTDYRGPISANGSYIQTGSLGNSAGGQAFLEVKSYYNANTNVAGPAFMQFHRPNAYAAYFGLDNDNVWKVGGWSTGAVAYNLWHSGNFTPGNYIPYKTMNGGMGFETLNANTLLTVGDTRFVNMGSSSNWPSSAGMGHYFGFGGGDGAGRGAQMAIATNYAIAGADALYYRINAGTSPDTFNPWRTIVSNNNANLAVTITSTDTSFAGTPLSLKRPNGQLMMQDGANTSNQWMLNSYQDGNLYFQGYAGGVFSANMMTLSRSGILTVPGLVSTQQTYIYGASGTLKIEDRANTASVFQMYNNSGALRFYTTADKFTVDTGGNLWSAGGMTLASGSLNINGTLYTNGQGIITGSSTNGGISLINGGANNSGYIEFWKAGASSRLGYIGYGTVGGTISLSGESATFNFVNNVPQVNGNAIWHGGNFNPGNYAALTGATYSGSITVPSAFVGNGGTMTGGKIVMDVSGTSFRLYENGGSYRGITLDIAGCGAQSGLWHTGNFTPGNYALLSGWQSFNNPIYIRNSNGSSAAGTLYMGVNNANFSWDGSNWTMSGSNGLYVNGGRVFQRNLDLPVISARWIYQAALYASWNAGGSPAEPYGNCLVSGQRGMLDPTSQFFYLDYLVYRYLQLQNTDGTWWTIGYS